MTPEQALDLARQAGGTVYRNRHYPGEPSAAFGPKQLMDFVAAVEAHTRDEYSAEVAQLKNRAEMDYAMAAGNNALIAGLKSDIAVLKTKLAEYEKQEPVATLHDDGYWTWIGTPPYESSFAGWRMNVYTKGTP